MVNASKILTVSYGTFSCTLEGFDDPFSTMRSIAEYFRDLAADDRYFGAEPPTPDPEMLHKIAEREIQRRVEAKVGDNEVVLRQVEDKSTGDTMVEGAPARASSHDETATTDLEADTSNEAVEDVIQDGAAESVAAKLARIRAAVARSRTETEPLMNDVFAEDEANQSPLAESAEVTPEQALEMAEPLVVDEDPAQDEDDSGEEMDVTQLIDTIEGAAESVGDEAEEDTADDAATDAMIDDKVSEALDEPEEPAIEEAGIEAETGVDQAEAAEIALDVTESAEESENDEQDVSDTADLDPSVLSAEELIAANLVPEVGEIEPVNEEDNDNEDVDLSSIMETADAADPEQSAEAAEEVAEDLAAEAEARTEDVAEDRSADTTEDETIYDDQPEGDEAAFDIDISALAIDEADSADDQAASEDVETPAEGEAHASDAPSVRVMKMSREAFDEMFEEDMEGATAESDAAADLSKITGDADEQSGAPGEDDIRATLGETGLSAEDEADLIRELVAVEQEGHDSDATAVAETSDESDMAQPLVLENPTEAGDPSVAEALESLVAEASQVGDDAAGNKEHARADDASVDRLLEQTDSRLDENEGRSRRSAIAHLKAAVAAVRADGGQDRDTQNAETERAISQFREDLAYVVKPSESDGTAPEQVTDEPTTEGNVARPQRPKSPERPSRRMPPLMLVSEQRIDKEEAEAPAEPVRPRRIQAMEDAETETLNTEGEDAKTEGENIFTEQGGFAGFVAETEPEGLQEMLEASLAYGLFVEGAEFNSRPQIMRRMLRQYPDGSVTREDGLRAFGVLLREGRIQRVKRGEFYLADTSRFNPNSEEQQANTA